MIVRVVRALVQAAFRIRRLFRHSFVSMSCPSWQWHRTGYRWSPVRALPVAPLCCDLGLKAAANLRLSLPPLSVTMIWPVLALPFLADACGLQHPGRPASVRVTVRSSMFSNGSYPYLGEAVIDESTKMEFMEQGKSQARSVAGLRLVIRAWVTTHLGDPRLRWRRDGVGPILTVGASGLR